ncbi:ATP-binding protein [Lewinella sp. IMCC34183]|uniref:ATP-binding protein n=1 Tax=Lewinella sp. IMCC34183 TaxID=2248762 RepID=UPI0018E4ED74|nr:ATP-binding protein [Lewinella sp. IMCC34183]
MNLLDATLSESTSQKIEEHARQFVDIAPVGYLVTDPHGRLLMANDTLLRWLGYAPDAPLPVMRLPELLNRGGKYYYENHLSPLLKLRDTLREIALDLCCKDGSELPVLLSAYRHTHDADSLQSFVVTNYTERRQYERELQKARRKAEASDRAKSEFLSTISHEILTPMNAILGTADLMGMTALSSEQQRLQNILVQSGDHLLSLFKNILSVSKSGLGTLEVSPHSFSPRQLVGSLVDSFRYGTADQNVTYTVAIDDDLPPALIGDPTLISQVLTNLLSNATKFSRGGHVTIRVDCVERGEECHTRFMVADTGIGISKQEQKRLFQPFTQASKDIHRQYGGAGLGLTVCQRILEHLNSRVEFESVPGKGSRFWFDLALPPGEAATDGAAVLGELPEIDVGRVLVVEDNETNAFLVSRYFRRWKVGFDLASNGQIALDMVDANSYDLILMDLKMPVMDGYTAARKIRELPAPKGDVPIIAFSASARMTMTDRMREAHIDDFTLKPFDPRKLHALVRRFLSPPPMNFTELRDAMDHNTEELESFSTILRRELRTAADELEVAFVQKDVQRIGDLKHKLKTSFQLLEAYSVKKDLQQAVDDLRAGRPLDEGMPTVIVEELRQIVRRLAREQW